MKTLRAIIFLLVLVLAPAFKIEEILIGEAHPIIQAKIPEFLGLGYNLLEGNPFTNRVDEGFRVPVFQFGYDRGETTQDGKYQIPDFTHSVETTACSMNSKVASYTGTQDYQSELSRISKFDTKLSNSFLKAAFTFSRTFEQFSNSTQKFNQTSYQTNAECTVYTLSMPIYSNEIALSKDFIAGVKKSIQEKNWVDFMMHFGTHYVSEITFGGRYFLEHTYSEESMSLFTSMNLDMTMAANIQYLTKIDVNLTDDQKKFQNQTNFISSKVDTTRLSAVGGLPPKSGNWLDWAKTVKDNLAPVIYRMTTLSTLFNFIPGIDSSSAVKSYELFLNSYCSNYKCRELTPERTPPKPLAISFGRSIMLAGQKTSPTTFEMRDAGVKVAMRVTKILMGIQGCIDSIQIFLSNGLIQHNLPTVGKAPFTHTYESPKGDQISCIRFGIYRINGYWLYSSMQYVTRNGVESAVYAGYFKPDEYRVLCLEGKNQHFVGFFGTYGNSFDGIGLSIMTETMQK